MKNYHRLSRTFLAIQTLLLLGAMPAYAFENPIKFNTFSQVVLAIADILIKIGVPLAAIFLIYGGFLFVSARGNEQQLKTAKDIFWYTIIGTALIVGAYAIASAVVNFAENIGGTSDNSSQQQQAEQQQQQIPPSSSPPPPSAPLIIGDPTPPAVTPPAVTPPAATPPAVTPTGGGTTGPPPPPPPPPP